MDIHALPYEIFTSFFTFLDVAHLYQCMQVCRDWYIAANEHHVWDYFCSELWGDKVYVPSKLQKSRAMGLAKEAYRESLKDGERKWITKEELCSFCWNIRFKKAAGDHWVEGDPWWHGHSPRAIQFLPDHTARAVSEMGLEEQHHWQSRKWRFVASVSNLAGPEGSFVQMNNYPPYVVSRYKNWGFIMQSCWVVWTSFPMPPLGQCLDLEDNLLGVTVETMRNEAVQYNMGVQFPVINGLQFLTPAQMLQLFQLFNNIYEEAENVDNHADMDETDDDDDEH